MAETIYFNGKKYDSVADMPSSVRQMYEKFNRFLVDENKDGIPDLMQSSSLSGLKDTFNMIKDVAQYSSTEGFEQNQLSIIRVTDTGIYVNGKGYNSVDEMPSHVRQSYQQVVSSAQDGRSEIYDEAWREVNRDEFFKPHDDEILNPQITRQRSHRNAPIETVDSNSRFILLIAVAMLLLGMLVMAWFIFF